MSSLDFATIRKNFERHGFTTQLFVTKEEATAYLTRALEHQTIGFGGSETLAQMGLYDALRDNNAVVWHNRVPGMEIRRLANCADIYITSANAVTLTGEIVNIDSTGNRVAMTAFGPEKVYYVVGSNKITDTVDAAIFRCRNVSAPQNARRLSVKTPCAIKADKCYNCNSPERICRMLAVIDRVPRGMQCEVLFVDEALGY